MLEKWKKVLDSGKFAGALLTDLSKAFDCINHNLLMAELHAYGFDHRSLVYIYSYLSGRMHRTKVNNSFSSRAEITIGVPQGSILGPLLFNIYINDIFLFIIETELANFADDNTPYSINDNVTDLLNNLENGSSILIELFSNNYLLMNADKSQLLVTKNDENISLNIDDEIIKGSKSVKLLGVTIDSKLDFSEHVSNICKKVSKKLHALARISKYICQEKLTIPLKAFIESQFNYCPLVWMFHSMILNNRINKLHERALRLVYKYPTLTFEQLIEMDNFFTIHHRNIQKLAIEIYKVINSESPLYNEECFPLTNNPYNSLYNEECFPLTNNTYNLRRKNPFRTYNVHSVHYGTETILYIGSKIWAFVPENIKQSITLAEFKQRIRS